MQAISVEELKARLDAGETLHLLDVREPSEHAEFNIRSEETRLNSSHDELSRMPSSA